MITRQQFKLQSQPKFKFILLICIDLERKDSVSNTIQIQEAEDFLNKDKISGTIPKSSHEAEHLTVLSIQVIRMSSLMYGRAKKWTLT